MKPAPLNGVRDERTQLP